MKKEFLSRALNTISSLAVLQETTTGLSGVYVSRQYFSGSTAIVQADLDAVGINMTISDFNTNVVPVLTDYLTFCSNGSLVSKDRKAMMNIARQDI